jgi:hypothetical protein
MAYHVFCVRKGHQVGIKEYAVLFSLCFGLSVTSLYAINLAESIGTLAIALAWPLTSFLLGWSAFNYVIKKI